MGADLAARLAIFEGGGGGFEVGLDGFEGSEEGFEVGEEVFEGGSGPVGLWWHSGDDCLDFSQVREWAFLSFGLGGDGMYGRIGPLIKWSGV